MTLQEVEVFKFKINGIEIDSDRKVLTATEILEIAEERSAIPGQANEYVVLGQEREYLSEDEVDIEVDFVLLSVPNAPTQVA